MLLLGTTALTAHPRTFCRFFSSMIRLSSCAVAWVDKRLTMLLVVLLWGGKNKKVTLKLICVWLYALSSSRMHSLTKTCVYGLIIKAIHTHRDILNLYTVLSYRAQCGRRGLKIQVQVAFFIFPPQHLFSGQTQQVTLHDTVILTVFFLLRPHLHIFKAEVAMLNKLWV